jgi:ABC-type uncharacterized transport system ATPase subunit
VFIRIWQLEFNGNYRYVQAEEIPVQYGGFKRENDFEFSSEDGEVSELVIKAGSTETIEIPAAEVLISNDP